MQPALWIALLWLAFAVTHTVPSTARNRTRLVSKLGEGPFLGLYSLVALAIFVPLVWIYLEHRHEGALLWAWKGIPAVYWTAMVVAFLGFTLTVATFFQPSPSAVGMTARAKPRGLTRITRHPLFVGLALIAVAHLALHGFLTDVLFFGGLLLYSVLGAMHQDARKRVTEAERYEEFYQQTSLVPFVAVLRGRTRLVPSELPWLGLLVGAAAAFGFYRLHFVMWI